MASRVVQRSFAAGELSPEFYGQQDQPFYKAGAKTLKNMVVTKEGSLRKRSGLEYVAEAANGARAIRFGASDGSDFIIVLDSGGGVRIFRDGYEQSIGAQAAWVAGLYSPGSLVVHGVVPVTYYATGWTTGEPGVTGWDSETIPMHHPFGAVLSEIQWAQLGDVLTITHPTCEPFQIVREATRWTARTASLAYPLKTISDFIPVASPTTVTPTDAGTLEDEWHYARDWKWIVTAVYLENGMWRETMDYDSVTLNCAMTPDFRPRCISISNTGTQARIYRIYRGFNGLYGLVGEIEGDVSPNVSTFWDRGAEPDVTRQPPVRLGADDIYVDSTNAPYDEEVLKPAACAAWNQRLVLGGFSGGPATLLISGTEALYDFSVNPMLDPSDADGIDVTLAAREREDIRAIVPANDLLVLTSRGEWVVSAEGTVTPRTLSARRASARGSGTLPPLQVGGQVLFVSRAGAVYALSLDANTSKWDSTDLTALASHLFEGKQIVDWAYQQRPDSIVWVVLDDGTLLSLTYRPEVNIVAWAQHETAGDVLAVTVADEGDTDTVYALTLRTMSTGTRVYLERMVDTFSPAVTNDGFYMDSARAASSNLGEFFGGLTVEPIITETTPGFSISKVLGNNPATARDVHLECTTGGNVYAGAAQVKVSLDGGATWGDPAVIHLGYNSLDDLGALASTGIRIYIPTTLLSLSLTLGQTAQFNVPAEDGYAQGHAVEVVATNATFSQLYGSPGSKIFIGDALSITTESPTLQAQTKLDGVLDQALPAAYQYPALFTKAVDGSPIEILSARVEGYADFAGMTVYVLADGIYSTAVVDGSGYVTLAVPAESVIVGLPYIATLELLDPADQKGTPARELIWLGARCATAGAPALLPTASSTDGGQAEQAATENIVSRRTIGGTLTHPLVEEAAGAVVQTYPYPLRILWVARDIEFQPTL